MDNQPTTRLKRQTDFLKEALPTHYKCKPKGNGIVCTSETGISDIYYSQKILTQLKENFNRSFLEVYVKCPDNYREFTVYFKR